MTEEEAKKKWCPHVRCDGNNRHWGENRDSAPISCCAASKCMMWEWEATNYIQDPMKPANQEVRTSAIEGHCGLTK